MYETATPLGFDKPVWVIDSVTGQICSTRETILELLLALDYDEMMFKAELKFRAKYNPKMDVYIVELK